MNYKIKLIEKKSTEDSVEELEVCSDIYKYNEDENLVEKIEFRNYKKYLKHFFNYYNSNIIEIKEYDFYDCKQNLRYLTKKIYNKNGLLTKMLIKFVPNGEIEKRKYKYKLEFYGK
ncbi:MAG: hypothetical protein HC854_09580 [Flavobacterium sp.]|nr:hypothetical protein [Flavobacterium sp.]